MKWIEDMDLSFLIPAELEGVVDTPLGFAALILLSLAITSVILIYISSMLILYRAKRIKYLGLDNVPGTILSLPPKINIYDKFLIRTYKTKDDTARNYFNSQYEIALKKKALEDAIEEEAKKKRCVIRFPAKSQIHPSRIHNQKN
jgi:hypothetical protein